MEEEQKLNGVSICCDDLKTFNGLLRKEDQTGHSSRALYYASPGAVPFGWESEPGTPKHGLNLEEKLAALSLTPPPFLRASSCRSPSVISQSPSRWSLKLSKPSNLSLKLSNALQIMRRKVIRFYARPHRVYAQQEKRYIWRSSKSRNNNNNE